MGGGGDAAREKLECRPWWLDGATEVWQRHKSDERKRWREGNQKWLFSSRAHDVLAATAVA